MEERRREKRGRGEERKTLRERERDERGKREGESEIVAFDLKLLPLSLHLPSSHSFPENASKLEGPILGRRVARVYN